MARLILDGGLPVALAAELRARGRDAAHVDELGLSTATDAEVLALDGVLVSTVELPGAVYVRGNVRDAVHRHAHEMARRGRGRYLLPPEEVRAEPKAPIYHVSVILP